MSDSDSGYEEDEGPGSFLLHDTAQSGDATALERMLGLSEETDMAPAMVAVLRRLVNLPDSNGCTPLHAAIIGGHAPCLSVLLRGGASPSKACDGNPPLALATCLALAAERADAAAECVRALLEAGADPHDRDDGGRTPLHWAATSGRTSLVASLLEAAAGLQRTRVGTLVAEAVEAGVEAAAGGAEEGDGEEAASGEGAASAVQRRTVVLPAGERPEHILAVADHDGLTPLHLAAKFGHPAVINQLLAAAARAAEDVATAAEEIAEEAAAAVAAAAAPAPAPAAAGATDGAAEPAARVRVQVVPPTAAAITALFPVVGTVGAGGAGGSDPAAIGHLLRAKARQDGHTPLQLAALYGRSEAVAALLERVAAAAGGAGAQAAVVAAVAATDKKGRSAVELARRRGHTALAAALEAVMVEGRPFQLPPLPPQQQQPVAGAAEGAATAPSTSTPATATTSTPSPTAGRTLLVAPPECHLHRTAPEPIVRQGPEPPPENVNRLHVLTQPGTGILHNAEFADLRWRTSGVPQAAMVDVLKCHEWSYVRRVIQACEALEDSPSCVGSLDPDTAISRHSMRAALAAAGAVCAAVDEVVGGKARNAFCAVRPPGHHAGPTGLVTNSNDSHGSHGFCLLSNVAIGAAYAVTMYRHAGIRRVAILDFDVHHGNGTQACVMGTVPTTHSIPIRTPYSEGAQHFATFKPWLGDGDVQNILFASVQGFGRRSSIGWFYPGSGATADTSIAETLAPRQPAQTAAAPGARPAADSGVGAAGAAAAAAVAVTPEPTPPASPPPPAASSAAAQGRPGGSRGPVPPQVPEDPEGEFRGGWDVSVVGGPRVINVGIPGPGAKPRMWRRAWRDKILPALVNFRPDLILISAGFDAHKKEDLNLHYVGVTESDYEWLTGQLVEAANTCCGGRLVSVLEGGYNLRGGPLGSAFARSVAAHVRSLAAPSAATYDPSDAEAERAAEKALEARRAAKAAALAGGLPTPRSTVPTPRGLPPTTSAAAAAAAGVAAAAAAAATSVLAASAAAAAAAAAGGPAPMDTDGLPTVTAAPGASTPAASAAAADGGGGGAGAGGSADDQGPPSKRRRRPAVDYAALNAQLERERAEAAAAAAAAGGGPGGGGAAVGGGAADT